MLGSSTNFARRLLRWYDRARRDLPWRAHLATNSDPDPYHVLVSEAMLQQTQVAAVVPYFKRFLERFPTLEALAGAEEQEVLRLWQGLGYYSRARNLQAAARKVVSDFGGRVPAEVEQLLTLPGVGRYTAGAVASIAFGRRAAILDGNVTRVLCRLDKIEADPRDRQTQGLLWARAEEILPKTRLGDFNSALMELGATVCTPRSPRCLLCPVREHCAAREAGVQESIPAPRKAKPTPLFLRHVYCIRRNGEGRKARGGDGAKGAEAEWLIEQRPARGRWAGMWQFVTVEAPGAGEGAGADGAGGGNRAAGVAAAGLPVPVGKPVRIGEVTHGLTHRRYHFTVFVCDATGTKASAGSVAGANRAWVTLQGLSAFPLPRPHLKIAEMLRDGRVVATKGKNG